MKKTAFLFYLVAAIICFTSCDNVKDPEVPVGDLDFNLYPGGDPSTYPWPTWTTNSNQEINALLEDYTGHKCQPCWEAGNTASQIEEENDGRVVLVSVHASPTGLFQSTDASYPIDYTTEAGDAYVTEMEGFEGNPQGTTNRLLLGAQNRVWQSESAWNNGVNEALTKPLKVNIQTQFNYYPETNGLFFHIESDFLTSIDGQYNLVNYLIRKLSISPQTTPFGTDPAYHHHNVLSGVIGPVWGVNLSSTSTQVDSPIYTDLSLELPDPAIDSTYAIDNLSVFTYVINRETYEILHVISTELD